MFDCILLAKSVCFVYYLYRLIHFNLNKLNTLKRCPEKCPHEKSPPENCPLTPEKMLPRKIAPRITAPRQKKKKFIAFDIILRLFLLKIFIVTSFRGASRTPATSIIDLLVTVVNGINYCHKKLLFRCFWGRRFLTEFIRWNFSKIFISTAQTWASDTR